MSSTAKRVIGLGLAVLLIVGIVFAVFWGRLFGTADEPGIVQGPSNLTVVSGVIGSEKKPFFEDPDVKAIFAEEGLEVDVVTAGSRQIATSVDLTDVDFVFPSSAPAAEKIKRETKASTVYAPFYSPMAIATFTPIVTLLEAAGIASKDSTGTWHLDTAKYLAGVDAGTRWSDLPGAKEAYPSTRNILIYGMTNPAASNYGFSALVAVATALSGTGSAITDADITAVTPGMTSFFSGQKLTAGSSGFLADTFLSNPDAADGIINYESVLMGLDTPEPLTIVTPQRRCRDERLPAHAAEFSGCVQETAVHHTHRLAHLERRAGADRRADEPSPRRARGGYRYDVPGRHPVRNAVPQHARRCKHPDLDLPRVGALPRADAVRARHVRVNGGRPSRRPQAGAREPRRRRRVDRGWIRGVPLARAGHADSVQHSR